MSLNAISNNLSFNKIAEAVGQASIKNDATTSFALAGRLYLSNSGWLCLSVPNNFVHGAFDAMEEQGVELPKSSTTGQLNAHISVMTPSEVEQLGADNITERGHTFRYTLGRVKSAVPATWDGVSRVWFIEVKSFELERLRKSYGLSGSPKYPFHITIAIRKTRVLQESEISKSSETNGEGHGKVQSSVGVQTRSVE